MTDRFDLLPLFRAHWRVLSIDTDNGETKGDWVARIGLLLPAVTVVGVMWWFDGRLANTGVLLAADSLLASGLLAVFAQISTLRLKLSDRYERGFEEADTDKDAMDESATLLLFACFLAFVNGAVMTVGMTVGAENMTSLRGPCAWVAAGLFAYLLLLLVMLIPRLLSAYTSVNEVRNDLSGFYRK